MAKKVNQLTVSSLSGNIGVNQRNGELETLPVGEIWFDELRPLGGDVFRDFCIAITGQIDEPQFGFGLVLFGIDSNEVDGPGTAGGRTDVSQLLAEKGIDQTRLADIGAA